MTTTHADQVADVLPHLRAAASDNHETGAQWRSEQMPIPVQETLPPRGRGVRSLAYYEPREPKTNDNVSACGSRMELKSLIKAWCNASGPMHLCCLTMDRSGHADFQLKGHD
ncbi:hypothetical protein N7467_004797 [Penicillium canescens]|nr:hypothetical protein N7467_004797 [Penicillium canescens]